MGNNVELDRERIEKKNLFLAKQGKGLRTEEWEEEVERQSWH